MNIREKRAHFEKIREQGIMLQEVSLQQYKSATRLVSEADSALQELGGSAERRQSAQHLSSEQRIKILGSLTG